MIASVVIQPPTSLRNSSGRKNAASVCFDPRTVDSSRTPSLVESARSVTLPQTLWITGMVGRAIGQAADWVVGRGNKCEFVNLWPSE